MTKKRRKRLISRLKQKTPHMKYVYGYHFKHSKIEKNTVLIESFHGKIIGDSGLVEIKEISKLPFDGFSDDDAEYAADHCGANWKKQAYRAAEDYLDTFD